MATDKLIATLQQIKTLADDALGELKGTERRIKKTAVRRTNQQVKVTELSFNANILAFMNRHARGLSGHQKFTLLLARLADGNASRQVSSAELEKQWNKMKAILGGKYNGAYANRAKANGWIDTPKHGAFTLSHSWKAALTQTND